ncbi:hypothetical protein JCM19274_2769 [Algibacter lectus]|uniref:Uncharacterized protein n=1 Tax=Algibacter lectus TaxID=221126 RepID=A0A090X0J8_9FLAO|nr:hypothetical protein [Algibacter lectus]GAL82058.1 hypothetical protein JCM19274_2769 [Algibacter lectus]
MKRLLLIFMTTTIFLGCVEDTYVSDSILSNTPQVATDLKYTTSILAREFGAVISAQPTYNSYGVVPTFEIVAVHDENGNAIDQNIIDEYLSIVNKTEQILTVEIDRETEETKDFITENTSNLGSIIINTNNPLALGTYSFDIKMTSTFDGGEVFENVFDSVYEIYLGPGLATGLRYISGGQNLLTDGVNNTTTAPIVFGGNPDIRFELGDNEDKFSINAETGVITLNSGYAPSEEPEIVSPIINVVSNVTDEAVSFNDAISIYISNDPFDVPNLQLI